MRKKIHRLSEVNAFKERNKENVGFALQRLKEVAISDGNIFEELLNTVQSATMGQITSVLYSIGGKYRRGM